MVVNAFVAVPVIAPVRICNTLALVCMLTAVIAGIGPGGGHAEVAERPGGEVRDAEAGDGRHKQADHRQERKVLPTT